MTLYIDTSVILRVLFNEPNPIEDWARWTEAYASRLWYTEALRVVDRMRLTGTLVDKQVVQLRRDIDRIHQALHVVSVSERVLARAGDAFPTVVGTLDAIHLATALHVHEAVMLDAFLTHDTQLATAAAAVGFTVRGV
jgi:predicted nucleic acid-binding protein